MRALTTKFWKLYRLHLEPINLTLQVVNCCINVINAKWRAQAQNVLNWL